MTEPNIIETAGEPASMSPSTRFVRTVLQVLVALVAAVPSAAALLDLSAETTAKVSGFAGALVVLVSALHNAFNASQDKTKGV